MSREDTVVIRINKAQMGLAVNQNEVARAAYAELRELARNRWGAEAIKDGALEFGYLMYQDDAGEDAGLQFFAVRRASVTP